MQPVTVVRMVPGLDDRVLLTLEPRTFEDLDSDFDPLYAHRIVGPTLGVDLDGTHRATFARGTNELVIGDTRAWLVQSERVAWTNQTDAPGSGRVPNPFVTAATIDRASLDVVATTMFDPPIVFPVGIGDELFDVQSMAGPEAFVRLRNADGSATLLHSAPTGLAPWCATSNGLILAYTGKIVSVRRDGNGGWTTREGTLPTSGLEPWYIACDAAANRAAIRISEDLIVFDIETEQTVLQVPGTDGPFALRSDGNAIVSVRSNGVLQVTDASGTRELGVNVASVRPPKMAADLALYDLYDKLVVIDLNSGQVTMHSRPLGYSDVQAWSAGFVAATSRYGEAPDYVSELEQLLVIDANGAVELPLPRLVHSPTIVSVHGARVYLRAHDDGGEPFLFVYDLSARQLVHEVPQPHCDEANILAERGC